MSAAGYANPDYQPEQISFSPAALQGYGDRILAGGERAIRVTEAVGGKSVVFVARHQDVQKVLSDDKAFTLEHYRERVGEIAPPWLRLLMVDRTAERDMQWEILKRAIQWTPSSPSNSKIVKQPLQGHEAIAREAVARLLATFNARSRPEFDIIGEYGYFVPYLVAREVFGLSGPAHSNLLVGLVHAVRRWNGSYHRFKPETNPYLNAVYAAQLVFGHLMANFQGRNAVMKLAARHALAYVVELLQARYDLAVEEKYDLFPGSLLSALREGRGAFALGAEEYRNYAISILLELFGTTVLVPGVAFTGVIEWMLQQPGGIPAQLAHIDEKNALDCVDEWLRLSPPSKFLLRKVSAATNFDDVTAGQDDYVCALVSHACRDPQAFGSDAASFRLGRPGAKVLHFGPPGGPHECLGRMLGRHMLAEMFLGLKKLPGRLARDNKQELGPWPIDDREIENVMMFPQLMVSWNRPPSTSGSAA